MISHLEKELSGNSLLFPIGRNKDGSLSKTSHALPEELFRLVLSFAKRKEESVKDECMTEKFPPLRMRWEKLQDVITVRTEIYVGSIRVLKDVVTAGWRDILQTMR